MKSEIKYHLLSVSFISNCCAVLLLIWNLSLLRALILTNGVIYAFACGYWIYTKKVWLFVSHSPLLISFIYMITTNLYASQSDIFLAGIIWIAYLVGLFIIYPQFFEKAEFYRDVKPFYLCIMVLSSSLIAIIVFAHM